MGFACSVADRIIFMDDGEIVEQGAPKEFFNNPKSERTIVSGTVVRRISGLNLGGKKGEFTHEATWKSWPSRLRRAIRRG